MKISFDQKALRDKQRKQARQERVEILVFAFFLAALAALVMYLTPVFYLAATATN